MSIHAPGPAVARPELLRESHWDDSRLGPTSRCCMAEFAAAGRLRSIAHFSNNILDFVVRPEGVGPQAAEHDEYTVNEIEGSLGGDLVLWFEERDQTLHQLNTGELMRVVVATPAGGFYCGRVKLRLHLVGITEEPDGADALDLAMNRLITQIREKVYNLPDEHLGGDRGLPMEPLAPDTEDGFAFEVGLMALDDTSMEPRLRGLWPRFVNASDLHYAALYHDWSLVCVGDAFDHKQMSPRFMNIEPTRRRALYRDIANRLRSDIARLRDIVRPAPDAPISRLVLDVQEGAIYIHWVGSSTGDFVLGVTLNQLQVDVAERRLRGLVAELPPPFDRPT